MTDASHTTTAAEKRQYRRLGKTEFQKVELPPIDYSDPLIQQRLFMANIAISWLGQSKAEHQESLKRFLADERESVMEAKAAMVEAGGWFRSLAELIDAALARSAIAAAANLTESADRDGWQI